ncbi:pyridoxamine 5'-phosphate oxidase family protein [Microlunatus speluncae]|uniref:pyridoxamine 5'-phosphate oxidase family protein n=1 Tax=Microlunatus speluncae TaxID=2594267 RepID=UPI00126669B8|nr:pyridoxamine 5'-phosphate oxidase family protein [Microlunatus speluncae]
MTITPIADRADLSPDYRGRNDRAAEPTLLPWAWAEQRLAAATNYWVSTSGPDGRPHPRPLWGLWHESAFLFTVLRSTRTARNLTSNPQATVHLESAREVVILDGSVSEVPPDRLEAFLGAWLEKYAGEGASAGAADATVDRVIYRLQPRQAHGWTLTAFPADITRWRFPTP